MSRPCKTDMNGNVNSSNQTRGWVHIFLTSFPFWYVRCCKDVDYQEKETVFTLCLVLYITGILIQFTRTFHGFSVLYHCQGYFCVFALQSICLTWNLLQPKVNFNGERDISIMKMSLNCNVIGYIQTGHKKTLIQTSKMH